MVTVLIAFVWLHQHSTLDFLGFGSIDSLIVLDLFSNIFQIFCVVWLALSFTLALFQFKCGPSWFHGESISAGIKYLDWGLRMLGLSMWDKKCELLYLKCWIVYVGFGYSLFWDFQGLFLCNKCFEVEINPLLYELWCI